MENLLEYRAGDPVFLFPGHVVKEAESYGQQGRRATEAVQRTQTNKQRESTLLRRTNHCKLYH
jgi:hypothetical protein